MSDILGLTKKKKIQNSQAVKCITLLFA